MIAIQELSLSNVLVLDVPCNELEVELGMFANSLSSFFCCFLYVSSFSIKTGGVLLVTYRTGLFFHSHSTCDPSLRAALYKYRLQSLRRG